MLEGGLRRDDKEEKEGIPIPPTKPKIWSMAELAVCKTPPPGSAAVPAWQSMQQQQAFGGGGGLEAASSLVRQNNNTAAMAALRSNMFGMGRDFPDQLESSKLSELPADTPPHTPPNKMQAGQHHNVINSLNSQQQPFHSYNPPLQYQQVYHQQLHHHQQQHQLHKLDELGGYEGMGAAAGMGEDCFNS